MWEFLMRAKRSVVPRAAVHPPRVTVVLLDAVRSAICDECDRFDADRVETGGRLIGTYRRGADGSLQIRVSGMIDAGQSADRGNTHLFQDGAYQERIFRSVEECHGDVEHFGTWHSHHVNGYPELSGGDIETYQRTVNHPQQNTDFWYALLVTRKVSGPERYVMRHYVLYRGDARVYELGADAVLRSSDEPLWVPGGRTREVAAKPSRGAPQSMATTPNRAESQRTLLELYPRFQARMSSQSKTLFWRGSVSLVGGHEAVVVVVETIVGAEARYTASAASLDGGDTAVHSAEMATPARAVHDIERRLNEALFLRASAAVVPDGPPTPSAGEVN